MKTSSRAVAEEALGGLSAGLVGTIIGFPLDTVKTRLQTSTSNGILLTGQAIIQKEGFLALYKGITPPLISLSILNTTTFASYSHFQHLFNAHRGWDVRNCLAGAVIGPMSAIVSTVENLIKTQMQLDNVSPRQRYSGSFDCARQLINEHGIKVLYTGYAINTLRETVFLTTYFGFYEGLRKTLCKTDQSGSSNKIFVPISGGIAGAIAWAVSFPLDLLRAGIQGSSNLGHQKTAMQVYREVMRTKGIKGLYSGVSPSIARAFLVSGSRFSAYEAALWWVRGGRDVER